MNTKRIRYALLFLPDKLYLKICYRLKLHEKLNIKDPQKFNEKMQWLKLYNQNPQYTIMVDKYRVREYISEKIGEDYLIPLVGGPYTSVEEINFDKLPEQFVLKCNHDSGSVIICTDKTHFDISEAKKKLNYCLKHNFWYLGREWPYKNVEPCIIAEKYMVDESGSELKDYKIFNFNGEPELIQVDFDRFKQHKRNLYDTNWNMLDIIIEYPSDRERLLSKPKQLDKMLDLARMLSKDVPFLRTDFYSIGDKIFFGELTFFCESGFGKIAPVEYEVYLGNKIKLDVPNKML